MVIASARHVGHRRAPSLGRLPARQREILRLASQGRSDKEIARTLGVSYYTVRTHLERLYQTHEVKGRTALVALWLLSGSEGGTACLDCQPSGLVAAVVSLFLGT